MSHRVRGGPTERAREDRIVVRDRAVGIHAKHLAIERIRVLREGRVPHLAHRHPELAVGPEPDPAPVVVSPGEHPGADHVPIEHQGAVDVAVAEHLVEPTAVVTRGTDVDEMVRRECGIQRDAHRSCFALGVDARDPVVRELRRPRGDARVDEDVPDALRHEHASVGREGDVPRVVQPRLDDRGDEGRRVPRSDRHAGDGDGEEDALILHPPLTVDDGTQMQGVGPGRLGRADLEGEGRVRTRRHRRLRLHGNACRERPVDGERRPLGVVAVDPKTSFLAGHALGPRLRAGVAKHQVQRRARLAGLQGRVGRLAHPRAVKAEIAHDHHEDALVLEVLDALEHRMQWQPIRARARRSTQRERERSDRSRRHGGLRGGGDAIRVQPANGHPKIGECGRVGGDPEVHLAAGDAALPRFRSGVPEMHRVGRRGRGTQDRPRALVDPRGVPTRRAKRGQRRQRGREERQPRGGQKRSHRLFIGPEAVSVLWRAARLRRG